MIHTDAPAQAGQRFRLTSSVNSLLAMEDDIFFVVDWAEQLLGAAWYEVADEHPAALYYALRRDLAGVPNDDEVLWGRVNQVMFLVHVSELKEPA